MVEVIIGRRERMTPRVPIGPLGRHETLGVLLKLLANAWVRVQILDETRMRRTELRIVDQFGILRELLSASRMFSHIAVVEARDGSTSAVSSRRSRISPRASSDWAARTTPVPLITAAWPLI